MNNYETMLPPPGEATDEREEKRDTEPAPEPTSDHGETILPRPIDPAILHEAEDRRARLCMLPGAGL